VPSTGPHGKDDGRGAQSATLVVLDRLTTEANASAWTEALWRRMMLPLRIATPGKDVCDDACDWDCACDCACDWDCDWDCDCDWEPPPLPSPGY
jgi:hypothetical protein